MRTERLIVAFGIGAALLSTTAHFRGSGPGRAPRSRPRQQAVAAAAAVGRPARCPGHLGCRQTEGRRH